MRHLSPTQLAGSSVFLDVLVESKQAFAYVLGDAVTGKPTHVIAWRCGLGLCGAWGLGSSGQV